MKTKQWQLAANALDGMGGFENGGMLSRYPRETEDKFKQRQEVAYYINHMREACYRFAGYLDKQAVRRETNSDLLKTIINNSDRQGGSINQFMRQLTIQSKARGSMLVLVDMAMQQSNSVAEQVEDVNTPYFTLIYPERVTDYRKNELGLFDFVEFKDTYALDDKTVDVIRHYGLTGWNIKYNDKILEQGEYSLNACPVLAFNESGQFPSVGGYYQIAEISKRIYNAQSELDEILRGQTFSILTYHVPPESAATFDASAVGSTIGTNNMLIYNGDSPDFVAPSPDSAKIYQGVIKDLEERINVITNNVDQGALQASGLALSLRFQNMNAQLLSFARQLEHFEYSLFDMAAKWLGINSDMAIHYPSDFSIIDKSLEIEVLQNMQALGAPAVYFNEKMAQIIQADLPSITDEIKEKIMTELETMTHERDE